MGQRHQDDAALYYESHLFVCTNRREDGHPRGSCAAAGSETIKDYMKARARELGIERVRVNAAACLDRCELGPCVVIYPEGVWYRIDSREAADEVLRRHVQDGGRVAGRLLPEA